MVKLEETLSNAVARVVAAGLGQTLQPVMA